MVFITCGMYHSLYQLCFFSLFHLFLSNRKTIFTLKASLFISLFISFSSLVNMAVPLYILVSASVKQSGRAIDLLHLICDASSISSLVGIISMNPDSFKYRSFSNAMLRDVFRQIMYRSSVKASSCVSPMTSSFIR